LIRKSKKKIEITANPFIQARHAVTLRSNPRRKGSGVYAGYETDCTFNYRLKNPDGHEAAAVLRFPLPSRTAMYDNLVVRLDGQDVLSQVRMDGDAVVLERTLAGGQEIRFDVSFRSRGLSSWYFIVREPREIRDFLLTLTVANLPRSQWNNPQECMTPTALVSTPDGQGTVASYQLDHAIVSKGMGVALPRVEQPGEREVAVLGQICKGWVLMFATAVLMLIVGGARAGELSAVLIGAAVACAYGLVGNLYDTVLGFWPGAALVLVPLFVLLGLWVRRALAGRGGMLLALALPYFGAVYPLLAAMDEAHELLYMNLSATVFLAVAAWTLLVLRQGTVVRE
jgi:hypothetical protein